MPLQTLATTINPLYSKRSLPQGAVLLRRLWSHTHRKGLATAGPFLCAYSIVSALCLVLRPVLTATHGLVPALDQLFPLGGVHFGLKQLVAAPQVADLLPALPHAGGKAGQIRRAKGGGLPDGRAQYLLVQDVGLELHQEVVAAGAAVHLQGADGDVGVLFHCPHQVGRDGDSLPGVFIHPDADRQQRSKKPLT